MPTLAACFGRFFRIVCEVSGLVRSFCMGGFRAVPPMTGLSAFATGFYGLFMVFCKVPRIVLGFFVSCGAVMTSVAGVPPLATGLRSFLAIFSEVPSVVASGAFSRAVGSVCDGMTIFVIVEHTEDSISVPAENMTSFSCVFDVRLFSDPVRTQEDGDRKVSNINRKVFKKDRFFRT